MTDSILIVGAGVAGLYAAQECARAGARALVVERRPVVGGRLAAPMTRTKAIGNRAEGLPIPLFESIADDSNIQLFTNSTLTELDGGPGNFDVSIRERARFVTDACTRCKLCHTACPVVRANEYDAGLTFRKAIYTPMAETLPAPWVIDIESCLNRPPNYLPCNRCVEVCEDDAIRFDLPLDTVHRRHVGAVILAPGFRTEGSRSYADLGYGRHPDVVTSDELQRLLEVPGPTGGYASKPSSEEYPDSVLLVLDELSAFGLYVAASQARQLLEQDISTVSLLVLEQPGAGREFDDAQRLAGELGISVAWGASFRVKEKTGDVIEISYDDFPAQRLVTASYDLVVLCSDVQPARGLDALASVAGIGIAGSGYLEVTTFGGRDAEAPVATTRAGIFAAGCATGAKTIRGSLTEAELAAGAALSQLDARLLTVGTTTGKPAAENAAPAQLAGDDLQAQLEKLLNALLG